MDVTVTLDWWKFNAARSRASCERVKRYGQKKIKTPFDLPANVWQCVHVTPWVNGDQMEYTRCTNVVEVMEGDRNGFLCQAHQQEVFSTKRVNFDADMDHVRQIVGHDQSIIDRGERIDLPVMIDDGARKVCSIHTMI